ncbi:unnamed protein product [Orchesella dallaii]|uniref:Uncharacterized protein n=1 Tax=Orchesella dallaii TaxID=48710 RepID=A0ABP1RJN9_9HEXA
MRRLSEISFKFENSQKFYLKLDSPCSIALLVPKNGTHDPKFDFKSSTSNLHNLIIYNSFENYDFRIQGEWMDKATLQLGHWRFPQRFVGKCLVYFIDTPFSFAKTLDLIDRSGHGNTEEAAFYLLNPLAEVNLQLERYLHRNSNETLPTIVAAIVLLTFGSNSSPYYAIYCHFCPPNKKLVPNLIQTTSVSHSAIQLIHQKNSGNLHGNLMYHNALITLWYKTYLNKPECLVPDEVFFRQNYFKGCYLPTAYRDFIFTLNGTFIQVLDIKKGENLEPPLRTLHVGIGTVAIDTKKSVRVHTEFQTVATFSFSFLYCIPVSQATAIKWDNYFTAFDKPTWFSIILVLFAYAGITRSFYLGIDLIWTLINVSVQLLHEPRFHWFCLLGLTMVTNLYQTVLGTDFYKFDSLESLEELLKKGFKIRVNDEQTLKRILDGSLPIQEKYHKFYQDHRHLFYTTKERLFLPGAKISDLVQSMVDSKTLIVIDSWEAHSLPFKVGKLQKVDDKFCKAFPFQVIPYSVGLYMWSYLARRANEQMARLNQQGIFLRYRRFNTWASQLEVEEKAKLYSSAWSTIVTDPKVFGFSASIRYMCIFEVGVLILIFVMFILIKGFVVWRNRRITRKD